MQHSWVTPSSFHQNVFQLLYSVFLNCAYLFKVLAWNRVYKVISRMLEENEKYRLRLKRQQLSSESKLTQFLFYCSIHCILLY